VSQLPNPFNELKRSLFAATIASDETEVLGK
jgi:hypothetical protein